jgi:hypothetical protein
MPMHVGSHPLDLLLVRKGRRECHRCDFRSRAGVIPYRERKANVRQATIDWGSRKLVALDTAFIGRADPSLQRPRLRLA